MVRPVLPTTFAQKVVFDYPKTFKTINTLATIGNVALAILALTGYIPKNYYALGAMGLSVIQISSLYIKLKAHGATPRKTHLHITLAIVSLASLLLPSLVLGGRLHPTTYASIILSAQVIGIGLKMIYKGCVKHQTL